MPPDAALASVVDEIMVKGVAGVKGTELYAPGLVGHRSWLLNVESTVSTVDVVDTELVEMSLKAGETMPSRRWSRPT